MLVRFPVPGRRSRKWVSVTLHTLYHTGWVYEVYRIPVINGHILYNHFWLHKVLSL